MLKHWPPPPRITFPLIGSVWDIVTRQHDRTGWHITEDTCPQLSPANSTENAPVQEMSRQAAAGWSLITTCALSYACSCLCVHQSQPTYVLTFILVGFDIATPTLPFFSSMRPSENRRALKRSGAFQVPRMGKRHSEPCLLAKAIFFSVWFSLLGLSGMYSGY